MKKIIIFIITLCFLSAESQAQCYLKYTDASGLSLSTEDQKTLMDSACALRDSFPKALQDSFAVVDFGFYAYNEKMDGGYPEFMNLMTKRLAENPKTKYYLLFGRESSSAGGPNSKIWVKVVLPRWGNFKCMSELQREIVSVKCDLKADSVFKKNEINPIYYAELATIKSLKEQVEKIVDCCYVNKGARADCVLDDIFPCNYPLVKEKIISDVEIINMYSVEDTPSDGIYIGGSKRNPANTEDLEYSFENEPKIYFNDSKNWVPSQDLFDLMKVLFKGVTICDDELAACGSDFIKHFKESSGQMFYHKTLSKKVCNSPQMRNYIRDFGFELGKKIKSDTKINTVTEVKMGTNHPVFSSLFDQYNGLKIHVNDTEETKVWIQKLYYSPENSYWVADIYFEVYDHFGMDKNDAITYQSKFLGFAAWWILQHQRNYKPFVTLIKGKATIKSFIRV